MCTFANMVLRGCIPVQQAGRHPADGNRSADRDLLIRTSVLAYLAALNEGVDNITRKAEHVEGLLAEDGHQLAAVRPLHLPHRNIDPPDHLPEPKNQPSEGLRLRTA